MLGSGKHNESSGGREPARRRASMQRRRPSLTQKITNTFTQLGPERGKERYFLATSATCTYVCIFSPPPAPTVSSSKSKNKKSLFRSSQPSAEDAAIAAAAARIPQESGGGGGGRRKKRGSFLFKKNNNNNNNEPETPATAESPWRSPAQDTRRSNDDILAEINHLVDESADSESMNNLVITTTNDHHVDDMSLMTDDFHRRRSERGLGSCGGAKAKPLKEQEEESYPPRINAEQNVLFTFQRRGRLTSEASSAESVYETTLNAKTAGSEEESMEEIVKRLQQKGSSSGVLKFDKSEIRQIKSGYKDIVFVLVQVNGAKFSKDEFGRMMASEVAGLTPSRPILIEIQTEDVVEGETLTVF